jgi:hypothetical protein
VRSFLARCLRRLLKLLGDSPESPPGIEHSIAGTESVSRFIYSGDHIFKQGGKPKAGAFLPRFEQDFNRHETSVCHLNGCEPARVWHLAHTSRPEQQLKGRVDFEVQAATSWALECLSSPEHNYAEHAVLVNWPPDKSDQKKIALQIAKACPAVTPPP